MGTEIHVAQRYLSQKKAKPDLGIKILEPQVVNEKPSSPFPKYRDVHSQSQDDAEIHKNLRRNFQEGVINNFGANRERHQKFKFNREITAKFIDPVETSEADNKGTERDSLEIKMEPSEGLSPVPCKSENPTFVKYDSIKFQDIIQFLCWSTV